jgi:hypothetical protein
METVDAERSRDMALLRHPRRPKQQQWRIDDQP